MTRQAKGKREKAKVLRRAQTFAPVAAPFFTMSRGAAAFTFPFSLSPFAFRVPFASRSGAKR
jgi:hypothetical protein